LKTGTGYPQNVDDFLKFGRTHQRRLRLQHGGGSFGVG
jgi:hypothetical protein